MLLMTGVLHRINPLSYRISIWLAHGFNGRYYYSSCTMYISYVCVHGERVCIEKLGQNTLYYVCAAR